MKKCSCLLNSGCMAHVTNQVVQFSAFMPFRQDQARQGLIRGCYISYTVYLVFDKNKSKSHKIWVIYSVFFSLSKEVIEDY